MPEKPSILIVGTGAMACLLAARLSAVSIPLTILGTWPKGLAALRTAGVTLVETDGREYSYPVQVITDPKDCKEVEHALILVKSWQTERAARLLQACLSRSGYVLTLQNGLGNRQILAESLGTDRISHGIITMGGALLGPGRVRSGGEGSIILEQTSQLTLFTEIFQQANIAVEQTSDIQSQIWGKLALNAAINPMTAILGVQNGALLAQPQSRKLMALAANEVVAVAAAQGIQMPYDDITATAEDVVRRTARNHSSMLQDVLRGAPTEIEAINGAILQAARLADVPVPVNQTLYLLVKSIINMKTTKSL